MSMREKREVNRLSGYLISVWVPPTNNFFSVPLPPPHCLSISIHFRTVVVNSNNFQIHQVYNLLSTNEINPSENIFNNNVMQIPYQQNCEKWEI